MYVEFRKELSMNHQSPRFETACSSVMLLIAILGLAAATISCDLSDTGDASQNSLNISPRSTNILTQSSALFTVAVSTNQNVVLPLVWSVDNPTLGRIVSAAGQSAIYQSSTHPGSNTITVRDQGDKEGLAQITISAPDVIAPSTPIIITNAPPVIQQAEPVEAANQTVNIIVTNGLIQTLGTVGP